MNPLHTPLVHSILSADAWVVTGSPLLSEVEVNESYSSESDDFITFSWETEGYTESEAFSLAELKATSVLGNDIVVTRSCGEKLIINLFKLTPIVATQTYKMPLEDAKGELSKATYSFDSIDHIEELSPSTFCYEVGGALNLPGGRKLTLDLYVMVEKTDKQMSIMSIIFKGLDVDNTTLVSDSGLELDDSYELTSALSDELSSTLRIPLIHDAIKEQVLKAVAN